MNKKYCVYELMSPSGKKYIGITTNMQRRISQHKNTNHILLSSEIEEYGFDRFRVLTLASNKEKKVALKLERDLIKKHQEIDKSLNGDYSSSSTSNATQIGIQVTEDLKADVKIKCAKEGITIREAVEMLLTKWVKK